MIPTDTLQRIERQLDRIEVMVAQLLYKGSKLMAKLQDAVDAVAEEKTVVESVVVLLDNLAKLVLEGKDDPAKLDELVANINAQKKEMADAVTRNTPFDSSAARV